MARIFDELPSQLKNQNRHFKLSAIEDGARFSEYSDPLFWLADAMIVNNCYNTTDPCKQENNLHGEIKWTKVTENYLQKYQNVIHLFFSFVRTGRIKVRIMFRNMGNQYITDSKDDKYFKLYYAAS